MCKIFIKQTEQEKKLLIKVLSFFIRFLSIYSSSQKTLEELWD